MMGLTRKQRACLDFLKSYIASHSAPPSLEEISVGLGASPKSRSNVHRLLNVLEERGHIRRLQHRARAIEIIEEGSPVILSPHVERAVAEYAERNRTTTQVAANELLAEYLGKVA